MAQLSNWFTREINRRRLMEARKKEQRKREAALCEECGIYPADLPSKLCAGCDAYREHTGAI